MIQERIAKGVYVKDVAAELGVHPRTISRALRHGGAPSGRRPRARVSKLDPYKPMIEYLLEQGVWNAQVILREIQAAGYQGKRSILCEYISPKRPLRRARATVRFETAPGRQLQNDWAKLRTMVAGREREVRKRLRVRDTQSPETPWAVQMATAIQGRRSLNLAIKIAQRHHLRDRCSLPAMPAKLRPQ